MANRRIYFKGQQITGGISTSLGELNEGYDGLEAADRDMVVDFALIGVTSGGIVTQHSPTPDLTVDVTAAVAYDQSGRRVQFPSTQTQNLALDSNAVSTAVTGGANSKIVSLFIRFKRDESDPRVDANAVSVNFVQDETFEFVVVQGSEGLTPAPPALLSDGILLADITLVHSQTQIHNGDISTSRRQAAFSIQAGSLVVVAGSPEASDLAILVLLNDHITGVSNEHPATAITYGGSGPWKDTTTIPNTGSVEDAIDAIVSSLGGNTGAGKVGTAAFTAGTVGYSNSSVQTMLAALAQAAGINYAGGVAWKDGSTNPATNVEDQIDSMLAALVNTSGQGGACIGNTPAGNVSATSVQAAINQLDAHKLDGLVNNTGIVASIAFAASTTAGPLLRPRTILPDSNTSVAMDVDNYRITNPTGLNTYTCAAPTVEGRRVTFTKPSSSGAFTMDFIGTSGGAGLIARFNASSAFRLTVVSGLVSGVLHWLLDDVSVWAGSLNTSDTTL